MEKYVTNIKDLVIQALTNGSVIKAKAESGDALSCFQMGMIHLLGINTSIDFKKASKFLSDQSLIDDPDANRLLGFTFECEGDYSMAFKNYANACKANIPYNNKVYEERVYLQGLFKNLDLPTAVLNKEITTILNEYIKGEKPRVDASIKLSMICEDEESCLNAAQTLFDSGDYYSAMSWLQSGKITSDNPLFAEVESKLLERRKSFSLSESLEVIEICGDSILFNNNKIQELSKVKQICNQSASSCKQLWNETLKDKMEPLILEANKQIEELKATKLAAEEAKKEKLKDNLEGGGGCAVLLIVFFIAVYAYAEYSFWNATFTWIIALIVLFKLLSYIGKRNGIELFEEKKKEKQN